MDKMIHPRPGNEEFITYWWTFAIEIRKALNLKCMVLYNCPFSIMKEIFRTLTQLKDVTIKSER